MGRITDTFSTAFASRVHARRRAIAGALAAAIAVAGCGGSAEQAAPPRRPQQAGQPANPYAMAGRVAAARAAAAAGDTRAAQAQVEAAQKDMLRAMRVPDPHRPVDHESARAAVRPLRGVRAAVWLDGANLLVMVDGQRYRSMDTIDRICLALEPLGDTLSVVINLQDVIAKNGDEATTLSRNCQLAEGERAFLQRKREVDVVGPELRRTFKALQGG
ncbi:MAG: hypothetical protein ABFC67_11615 [Mizugakiibacter sp.]|uniref:hypothetical protein n=1 Tax=Mizugakiibacter sp. TaxID=1972610 RepID=UPI0031C32F86|nr:hypothetical protein [Xanthomonadaceae bacterium]